MRFWSVLIAGALAPLPAAADLLTFWVAGKGAYLDGTGDVFTNFDSPFGGGAEAGVEVLGIDLWGEALIMGADQYFFSANLGIDLSFGDKTRVNVGLFTGPVFFMIPPQEATEPDFSGLTAEQRTRIEQEVPGGLNRIAVEFAKYAEEEETLSQLAVGWNLGRLRLDVEQQVAKVVFIGLGGQVGYHFILTGEEAAAGARNQAVDEVAAAQRREGNALDRELVDAIREAVGAKEVDQDELDGLNYSVGAYVKLEF